MTDEPETETISGHLVELPGNRSVWAGRHLVQPNPENPDDKQIDGWYIKFRNGDAETRIAFSNEAALALIELLTTEIPPVVGWTVDAVQL